MTGCRIPLYSTQATSFTQARSQLLNRPTVCLMNALPSTTNFASLNVLGIALKRLISLVFLVCNIFICVIEYAPSDCFIERFRAAVSVHIGPCYPALLESYSCKCAYCCIIGQIK